MGEAFYNSLRSLHDPDVWKNFTAFLESEFQYMFLAALYGLVKTFNVWYDFNDNKKELRQACTRGTSVEVMFFIFVHMLWCGKEGRIGLRTAEHQYALQTSTIFNQL